MQERKRTFWSHACDAAPPTVKHEINLLLRRMFSAWRDKIERCCETSAQYFLTEGPRWHRPRAPLRRCWGKVREYDEYDE